MLRIEGLISPLLHIPWLEVSEGECVAIMGASGAGKSLFLRSIVDLDPNRGEVSLDGRPREGMSACEWRRQVMFVPAESGWWADTVGAHFLADQPAETLIAALGLPPEALSWSVARLSSGERHRLAIARALSFQPRAMLLDEPTASLDSAATESLESVLKLRLSDGACLLLVTHDKDQAARMASRMIVIADGRIVQTSVSAA
ncbi:MAG: ABC transporter ATP-binding protein [Geminicoccaceae bacterium]